MKERKGEHPFGDAGQLIALAVFLVIWAGDSFLLHYSTFLAGRVPLYARLAVSGLLILIAYVLYRASHFIVAQEERPNYVVTRGAFRYIRHPLYLCSLVIFLSLVVSTFSVAAFVTAILIFGFYDYIAGYEEKLLERKFGQDYLDYKQRTGKWLPRLLPIHNLAVIPDHSGENRK